MSDSFADAPPHWKIGVSRFFPRLAGRRRPAYAYLPEGGAFSHVALFKQSQDMNGPLGSGPASSDRYSIRMVALLCSGRFVRGRIIRKL